MAPRGSFRDPDLPPQFGTMAGSRDEFGALPWDRPRTSTVGETPTFRINTDLIYDRAQGELHELIEGQVQHVTKLRAKLMEEFTIRAVIVELERLGYTVTHPNYCRDCEKVHD